MTACEVREYMDWDRSRPILARVEAETFDLCRAALILAGAYVKGNDGFFYDGTGKVRVVLQWVDPEHPSTPFLSQEENHFGPRWQEEDRRKQTS